MNVYIYNIHACIYTHTDTQTQTRTQTQAQTHRHIHIHMYIYFYKYILYCYIRVHLNLRLYLQLYVANVAICEYKPGLHLLRRTSARCPAFGFQLRCHEGHLPSLSNGAFKCSLKASWGLGFRVSCS